MRRRADSPPYLGAQAAAVLEVLLGGEEYGLRIAAKSGGRVALRAVYVVLGRMVDAGLIEVARIDESATVPRTVYRPTERGRRAIAAHRAAAAAWAADPEP